MGAKKSNLIPLSDLRWASRGIQGGNIDWEVFLNILEDQTVSLQAPINTNSFQYLQPVSMKYGIRRRLSLRHTPHVILEKI